MEETLKKQDAELLQLVTFSIGEEEFGVEISDDAAQKIADLGIVGSAAIAEQAIPRSYIVSITGDEAKSAAAAVLNVLFTANPKSVGGKLPGDDLYAG